MKDAHYQGKPCRHGHEGVRYKSNNICIECSRRYSHVAKEWAENNPEQKKLLNKLWYENNKERKHQKQAEWNSKNKDKIRAHWQNRKSRVGGDKVSWQDIQKIFAFQRGCCAVCKTSLDSYEVDHIMPLSLGGKHVANNIQILCQRCNRTKHAKDPVAFMQSQGYLL